MPRLCFWVSLFFIMSSTVVAVFGGPPPKVMIPPGTKSMREPRPSADLQSVLKKWLEATSRIQRLDINFKRIDYDSVFEVETRGEGHLSIDRSQRGDYQLKPVENVDRLVSNRTNASGKRYSVQASDSEWWHWTSESMLKIDVKTKTYEKIHFPEADKCQFNSRSNDVMPDRPCPPPLPEDSVARSVQSNDQARVESGSKNDSRPRNTSPQYMLASPLDAVVIFTASIVLIGNQDPNAGRPTFPWFRPLQFHFPFKPFLFGLPEDELKSQFEITLVKNQADRVQLKFVPKLPQDLANYKEVELLWSTQDSKPIALKLVDPTGTHTVVYTASDVQINRPDGRQSGVLNIPDLKGFRMLIHEIPFDKIKAGTKEK